jgi:EAL domain-containing protein (putative c-di-GMP-specific phosphodiesterase class I)
MEAWFLESVATDSSRVTHRIAKLPFRIGRDAGADLAVEARGLSRQHAEFREEADGRLLLADLGSTNGTWVNRQHIDGPRWVVEKDIIHFGNAEFRLGLDSATRLVARDIEEGERTMLVPTGAKALSQNFVEHEREFRELLAGKGLTAAVQPIVQAQGGALFAYELLGRCEHPQLKQPPGRLFDIARKLNLKAELSAAFRQFGVPAVAPHLQGLKLFVNTDPDETFTETFFQSLRALRELAPPPALVIEVHETAVMDGAGMRTLAQRITELGLEFAYDDFGAGDFGRMKQLFEVPPHYVKVDMGLIRGIDRASDGERKSVADLVRWTIDVGAVPLAEGVETDAEAAVCRDLGFELIQGYLTGKPVPVASLAGG